MTNHRLAKPGVSLIAALVLTSLAPAEAASPPAWSSAGANNFDDHAVLSPAGGVGRISPASAPNLALLWSYAPAAGASATPAVEAGGLYVTDYAGGITKLDPDTGALIWSHKLSDYTGSSSSYARTSPAIGPSMIVVGDAAWHSSGNTGAKVMAIDKTSGAKLWTTIVDTATYALVAGAPVIYNGRVYVGLASGEEYLTSQIKDFVPTFRGAVVALDAASGAVLWTFYTVPPGYTGGAVFGSNPVVRTTGASTTIYVGTGNNYTIPAPAAACLKTAGKTVPAQLACLDPADYVDSIVSLNAATGAVRWTRRLQGADTWNEACSVGFSSCPTPLGPDDDFASAPNLVSLPGFVGARDDRGGYADHYLLGAGQKSGVYWGLNPDNGGLFWSRLIGIGGIQWGSAIDTADHKLVFASLENAAGVSNVLAGPVGGQPVVATGGAWTALDILTGKVVWQIPSTGADLGTPARASIAEASNSFTNRVLFTGSSSGEFAAIDAASGLVLWRFQSGDSVRSGPAIFADTVFWATGRRHAAGDTRPSLFAFRVPPS